LVPQEQLEFQRQELQQPELLQAFQQQVLALQKCRVSESNPKRSSLRELRILLPAPKTLRGQELPAPQLQLQQLPWVQLLFSQQLSWLEPSLQVLRHRQEQHQLSSQRPF
jgi:hypothetical protein